MAPTRSRKVRYQELQVTNNPAGAQADGGHHHQHSKTQSIATVGREHVRPTKVLWKKMNKKNLKISDSFHSFLVPKLRLCRNNVD